MLQLKNIYKSYTTGGSTQIALDGINLKFRQNEFVVILGPSGSGKTTFLNIIGGLERYDKGDLIVNNCSTKLFTEEEWDFYRNNNIGFIFKEHNLIEHLTILENVQMASALVDLPNKEKRKRAVDALERVGLKDYIMRTPDKLSKEEMQKVAIARALVNDPDIILADEPTGNLDGNSSIEIMNLIKEVFKEKLVVLVSQNPVIAKQYATRVIEFRDAEIISDSNPLDELSTEKELSLNKTKIKFITAFKLAIRDLSNKKLKTAICVFISGINISIIAMLIALVSGFSEKINNFENDTLNDFPIIISKTYTNIGKSSAEQKSDLSDSQKSDTVHVYNWDKENKIHNNYIDKQYIEYIRNMDSNLYSAISYNIEMNMNILRKDDQGFSLIDNSDINFYSYPNNEKQGTYLQENYDLLYGYYPTSKEDIVLVLDENNRLDEHTLEEIGVDYKGKDSVEFDEIIGKEFKLLSNDDFYKKSGNYFYVDSSNESLEKAYNSDKSTTVTITAILKPKAESNLDVISQGILYSNELCDYYIRDCLDSKIVKAQQDKDYNVITGQRFKSTKEKTNADLSGINSIEDVAISNNKEKMICLLGGGFSPSSVTIYPKDFDSKNEIIRYLNTYNSTKDEESKIYFNDTSNTVSAIASGIMSCIIIVLMCFGVGNLFISIIMVAMITYISIADRKKEIAIFKLLGARDRDIKNLFNVQILLIGFLSWSVGMIICHMTMLPISKIIENLTSLDRVAFLDTKYIVVLLILSILISYIGAIVPKYVALKKDFVSVFKK